MSAIPIPFPDFARMKRAGPVSEASVLNLNDVPRLEGHRRVAARRLGRTVRDHDAALSGRSERALHELVGQARVEAAGGLVELEL